LITQGAMYRSGILTSKEKVLTSLRAESLARTALKHIGLAAFSAWRGRSGLAASGIRTLLPFVFGGISRLWRQPGRGRLVRGVVLAGTVASVFSAFSRLRKKRTSDAREAESEIW